MNDEAAHAVSGDTVPPGIRIERSGSGLVMRRRWRTMFAWALLAIAVVTAGIGIPIVSATASLPLAHPVQLIPAVVCGTALVLLYLSLIRFVNATSLSVTADMITITHGPLPWRRGATIAAGGFERFCVVPVTVTYSSQRATFYNVRAERGQGDAVDILDGDAERAEAECVARELAVFYGREYRGVQQPDAA